MTDPAPPPVAAAQPADAADMPPPLAPAARPSWLHLAVRFVAFTALFAALLAPGLIFADNTHRLTLFARCLSLAVVALGADLIWGYTGLLSLGQALYFGLGAYMVAYSLKLQEAATRYNAIWRTDHVPGEVPPDFMAAYGDIDPAEPPAALAWIAPLGNIWIALAAAVVLPMVVAFLFGLVTFSRRIRGVYFALITQAVVLIAFLVVDNQQLFTGGRPGINEIAHLKLGELQFDRSKNAASKPPPDRVDVLGVSVSRHRTMQDLYFLNWTVLAVCFLGCAWLVQSKFGKLLTAIRDNENRVLALGYNTARYKLAVFTAAAGLAGLGGALFVPVVGKMGPSYIDVGISIEIMIFVAVGGRGTLVGAILGALLVHYGTSYVGELVKDLRPIIIGLLFVGVVLFLPQGIWGLLQDAFGKARRALGRKAATGGQTLP